MNTVNANALHLPFQSGTAQMCVTSPPYWSLRDYGTATWDGGDPECDHAPDKTSPTSTLEGGKSTQGSAKFYKNTCIKCGATRVDNQLGLEKVPDCLGWATGNPCGECYVCHTVAWAREVWRVLRDDGCFWINLGDSYASDIKGSGGPSKKQLSNAGSRYKMSQRLNHGVKQKDLIGIPWRVALALQADGWYLRSDVIWAKPNPMPESVTDRPTKAHEYIFLLAKSQRYYWDQEAVREGYLMDHGGIVIGRGTRESTQIRGAYNPGKDRDSNGGYPQNHNGRNLRSVWTIATQPTKEAHFATFAEAIPERCIKAGTSERGACPKCGKAWERNIEKVNDGTRQPGNNRAIAMGHSPSGPTACNRAGEPMTRHTTGWQPACTCNAGDPVPCIVLDPFSGSGTVERVCIKNNRRFIGTELNYKYIQEIATKRTDRLQVRLIA